jgi:hypothetical protein
VYATSPSRSSLSQTIIAESLDDLVNLFQQDGIHDVSFPGHVSRAKQFLRDGHVKDASKSLGKIVKELRPLDIQEVFFFVDKTHEAAQKIVGKNIVLFLGKTGSGILLLY